MQPTAGASVFQPCFTVLLFREQLEYHSWAHTAMGRNVPMTLRHLRDAIGVAWDLDRGG